MKEGVILRNLVTNTFLTFYRQASKIGIVREIDKDNGLFNFSDNRQMGEMIDLVTGGDYIIENDNYTLIINQENTGL